MTNERREAILAQYRATLLEWAGGDSDQSRTANTPEDRDIYKDFARRCRARRRLHRQLRRRDGVVGEVGRPGVVAGGDQRLRGVLHVRHLVLWFLAALFLVALVLAAHRSLWQAAGGVALAVVACATMRWRA